MPLPTRIQLRRDTASNWTSVNPTLEAGEIGVETDTRKIKIGNGASAWSALSYAKADISDLSVNDLSDVVVTSATNGQVLKYNGTNWVNAADSTGTTINSLDDIGDVTITSVSEGQVLKYNGSAWINSTDSTGTSINALNDIGDVTITSVSNGQVLQWNGTAWVNAEATATATTSIHPFAMLG